MLCAVGMLCVTHNFSYKSFLIQKEKKNIFFVFFLSQKIRHSLLAVCYALQWFINGHDYWLISIVAYYHPPHFHDRCRKKGHTWGSLSIISLLWNSAVQPLFKALNEQSSSSLSNFCACFVERMDGMARASKYTVSCWAKLKKLIASRTRNPSLFTLNT